MAKQAVAVETKPGIFQRVQDFITEVRQELDKVTWPTVEDVKVSTRVCLYMLAGMIVVVFGLDQVFNFIVINLLKLAG
jgi:preprotein translocase SecE subunit